MINPRSPFTRPVIAVVSIALLGAFLGALLGALLGLAAPARAGDYSVGSIAIVQPWARATPKGASTGAAYMTVTNNGTTPDRMTCLSDDASARCEIHSMTITGGVMQMRPVEGGLEIKPGETVTFKPGGYHIMLVDLKHALVEGQAVKATLKFDRAGTVEVMYPIAGIGAPAPGVAAGGGSMMMQTPGGAMSAPGMQMNKP